MCQALMEIMEPVMQLRDQENIEKGLKKGIQVTIDTLREFGHGDEEIKAAIMRKYDISVEEVKSLEIKRLLPAHHQLNISVGIIGRIEKAFSELSDTGMLMQGAGIYDFEDFQIHI